MNVIEACKPRFEVLKGDLDDAIFAADFGDLISGKAPKVYSDPATFFQNTHPAAALQQIVGAVFGRLNDPKEGGVTVRLSTGFGGGKTHALMSLWHLAESIADKSLGAELLPVSNRPQKVTTIAVDLGKAGVPIFNQHGSTKVRSLWGEMFYLLKPDGGLDILGKADDPEGSPNSGQIEQVLPEGPILILLDEIVIYMAKLSERGKGNLLGFLNLLSGVVRNRPQTCLVVTDPGSQAVYAAESAKLAAQLTADAAKLEEIFGRKMSDLDPIGSESAKVIVRRLFESVDDEAPAAAAKMYSELYQRVIGSDPKSLPPDAGTPDYSKSIVQAYPFHPRLLETARDRLAALDNFQQSRGVLRLFARILRDVWEQNVACDLITAGEIDWTSSRIQSDLLQRLNRDRFKSAVSADIAAHALELDSNNKRGVHTRAASALLLESLPLTANSGMDEPELTLAILRPEEAGEEPAEAMDRLAGVCWHTYPMPGGRGLQFRFDQNILKQIDERRSKISREDAISRVQSEVQQYFQGPVFKLSSWPSSPSQVAETDTIQLALCENEQIAKRVVTYADDRDESSPIPRGFRNAIVAVTATPAKWDGAVERAQRLMAAEQIERENKTGSSSAEIREQLGRIMPDLKKQFLLQAYRAFDRVIVGDGTASAMEEQYLVDESKVLQKPRGQDALQRFLVDKSLIYETTDAIDANRFVTTVLPGTTPFSELPDAFTAAAVHERILSAPGLRLVPSPDVVRNTILKAVAAGKVVVRLNDGSAYDSKGRVSGPTTDRRREKDELRTLSLDDSTIVTTSDSDSAKQMLAETPRETGGTAKKGPTKVAPPPPPPAAKVSAQTWEKIIEYSEKRPLLELKLVAPNPSIAATLATLGQPLGADSLTLNVSVGGPLKDGGTMNFSADEVKLTHPAKPFTMAQTLFNSAGEGVTYEAQVALRFKEPGRTDLTESLRLLAQDASADIKPTAFFDKPLTS